MSGETEILRKTLIFSDMNKMTRQIERERERETGKMMECGNKQPNIDTFVSWDENH